MTDSNINAEQQATKLLTKLLREHAMEVKLVGGFMEVSPTEIIFLLDKIESLKLELEIEKMRLVACGADAFGKKEEPAPGGDTGETFTAWLKNTGEFLVPDQDNMTVEVILRDGTVQRGRANQFDWHIIGDGGDILHYRGILNKDQCSR